MISERHEPYPYLLEDFPKMPPLKGYYKGKGREDEEGKDDKINKSKKPKLKKSKIKNKSKK